MIAPRHPHWFIRVVILAMLSAPRVYAADLDFSDPAKLLPPPAGAVGYPSRAPDLDALPGFVNPPPGYGEVGFYWWLGDPLTKERLAWELDQLQGKGVAALQVNYAHSDRGGRSYGLTIASDPPLFSAAWWDLYGWFLKEAKRRGMAVSLSDYTLGCPGQGWYIDEILKEMPDIAGATLQHTVVNPDGGKPLIWNLPENTVSVVAYRVQDGRIEPDSDVDLRPQAPGGRLQWHVPPGRWQVVAVSYLVHPVSFNPMHPLAGKKLIEKLFQRFEDRNPGEAGKGLNFFFSDELSFGVHGNLWDSRFAAEFRRRKGYDLMLELPALFVDIGPRTPKIRLDYSDVMVSLEEENYFRPLFQWHYQRGMLYGCDHGGRGKNVVEFGDYFRTQRWMTGTGNDQPRLSSDIIKSKVNSSIVHLYQRPRVWLEGYYGSGWGTTSAQVADATFRNFAQGHTLLTLHGLYYSTHGGWWEWAPPCNHFHMPYWPHLCYFLQCAQRLSYLLSQGRHYCDVAIVYPVASMEAGMDGQQSVHTAFDLGTHLYNHGIDFDFIDFESVARARIEDKKLCVSGEAYRVLVFPAMKAVRWSMMPKAAEFRRAGGIVLAVGGVPEASDRAGRDDPELNALVKATFPSVVASNQQVAAIINRSFPRDFNGPGQVLHRKVGPRDVYMVYGAPRGSECFFRAQGSVELWDPWTGRPRPLAVVAQSAEGTRVRMSLEATEAQLIVFSPGEPQIDKREPLPQPTVTKVEGDWEFELKPTLDNRFGDYRLPAFSGMIGAEARQVRYADETAPSPGWQDPKFDDSKWPKVTCCYGPKFWRLGPLPEKANVAALERQLAALTQVDPALPVTLGGKKYAWHPYSFSWRHCIEGDPGHQGYHGLKGEMSDEFIALGRLKFTATGSAYAQEGDGTRYYLWTSAPTERDQQVRVVTTGNKPAAVYVRGQRVADLAGEVQVKAGPNPLLVRYDHVGRAAIVLESADAPKEWKQTCPLAMTWYKKPGVLPLDPRPEVAKPAGWYRFLSPPGFRSMLIPIPARRAFQPVRDGLEKPSYRTVRAWANGREMAVSRTRQGVKAIAAEPQAAPVLVAVRIEQERGCYGGAALEDPIALACAAGTIAPCDWSQIDGLASYSGGAWYRKTVTLTPGQLRGRTALNLGNVVSSAEVQVNGRAAGIRVAPPWTFDVSDLVKPGENRIEVLVYNTLANHYSTIPTRYRGQPTSGLLGPVTVETWPGP